MTVLDALNEGDACSLLFLILVLAAVGGAMVSGKPKLHLGGKRAAAAAFVLYSLYATQTMEPEYADDWIGIALRAVLAAGLALGAAWILFASGEFLFRFTLKSASETEANMLATGS